MLTTYPYNTERVHYVETLKQAATLTFESTAEGVMITGPSTVSPQPTVRSLAYLLPEAEVTWPVATPASLLVKLHDSVFFTPPAAQPQCALGHWQGEIWNKRKERRAPSRMVDHQCRCDSDDIATHRRRLCRDISSPNTPANLDHQAHQ
jgi:hypothetical protein